ncbi:hypothetical protein ES288_D06G091000v1 [Gossypium darwinii]|uniref:Protein kinase domain-containing protein n=1 Tax=Gossypium darwinii TaxID=34276 RepID=A0A5D2C3L4_GOSDA|nr:hypothetical protein ES288_D06G091000v1 [Gossypium darwinii]
MCSYCFLLLLQLLVQLKLPFNLRINIWYYRAPELIFGATEYTTDIDICSAGRVLAELLLGQPLFASENGVDQVVEIIKVPFSPKF